MGRESSSFASSSSSSSTARPRTINEEEEEEEEEVSGRCGRCMKMKVPIQELWSKSRNYIRQQSSKGSCKSSVGIILGAQQAVKKSPNNNVKYSHGHGSGGFRYDPLSYAQNFDEGLFEFDNQDDYAHVFSSRFAALPSAKSTGQYKFLNQ